MVHICDNNKFHLAQFKLQLNFNMDHSISVQFRRQEISGPYDCAMATVRIFIRP